MIASVYELERAGLYSKALQHIQTFEAQMTPEDPSFIPFLLLKCRLLLKNGQYLNALSEINLHLLKNKIRNDEKWNIDFLLLKVDVLSKNKQYNDALLEIEKIFTLLDQATQLSKNEREIRRAYLLRVRGYCGYSQGAFDHAKKDYEQSLAIAESVNAKEEIATTNLFLGTLQYDRANYDQAVTYFKQSLALFQEIKVVKGIADSLNNIGLANFLKGNLDEANNYFQQSMKLREEMENSVEVGKSLLNIGVIYRNKGELEQALTYNNQALAIFEKLDYESNKLFIALVLNNIAVIYYHQGKFDPALKFHKKSLQIKQELDDQRDVAVSLLNIATIYQMKGNIKRALEYAEKSLEIDKNIGNKYDIAIDLSTIATIYRMEYRLEIALKYFQQSLELLREIGNNLTMAGVLANLVSAYIEAKELDKASKCLTELKIISNKEDNRIVRQYCQLAEALMLKISDRPRHKFRALEIFAYLAQQEVVSHEITIEALLNWCELLLFDFITSGAAEARNEISRLTQLLTQVAEEQQSSPVLVQVDWFKAKLAIIENNIEAARKLLSHAQATADEAGLRQLAMKISSEHDLLIEKLAYYEATERKELSLAERAELAQISDFLQRLLLKKTAIEVVPAYEKPLMFLIMTKSGISVFSKVFSTLMGHPINEQLLSSYLTAINAFGGQIFERNIDRVRLGEYTLILKAMHPLIVCYVFEGPSYSAIQKIHLIIEAIRASEDLWNSMLKKAGSGGQLTSNDTMFLDILLRENFSSDYV